MDSNADDLLSAPYIWAPDPDTKVRHHVAASAIERNRVGGLVEQAQAGDRDAFGELYRLCHPSVHRFVRFHLPGPHGEDAVAETFLRAWMALPRYRDTGAPFSAWLVGIARHVVADAHRAARRVRATAEVPDRAVEFQEQTADRLALAAAVERLSREQRQVIELKYLVGLSNQEVGRALGKSVGAINALQWRALGRLRQIMEPR